jgi:SPP1 family predicted phage head-tail adaptor
MIDAGKLRHKISILKNAGLDDGAVRNDYGQVIDNWQPFMINVWADVLFKTGSKFISQDREQSRGIASVRIRYRRGLNSAMRVLFDGVTYKMVAPPLISRDKSYIDLAIDEITPEDEA